MHPLHEYQEHTRRDFLTTSASGLGGAALAALLANDDLPAASPGPRGAHVGSLPLTPKATHFSPKAKSCIFFFMAGAPSQIDLFDYKPKLQELHGQKMPESLLVGSQFPFIQRDTVKLLGSTRPFRQHGESGMWFSDLLPHIATCADDICMVRSMHTSQFNHHPAQLMMQCGEAKFGLPTVGAWISYGLGTENQNLPGYVVLTAGRGSSGGATLWQSGFLSSLYEGVRFRNEGAPILNLRNPDGLPAHLQRRGLDAIAELNQRRFEEIGDPQISSRIANYELAFRMQSAAPELGDFSGESQSTLDNYGVDREDAKNRATRNSVPGVYKTFARNCLLARRMVERGVRFVNIIHASWDHHNKLDPELTYNSGMADQPIAALIKDLKQRGLLDSTLVVWAAEFGRTPMGENRVGLDEFSGRDHHRKAFSIWMAGGGVKSGLTYGKTDDISWDVAEDPVHINDFQATLLHLFGLDHKRLTVRHQGLDQRLTTVTRESRVIDDLIA